MATYPVSEAGNHIGEYVEFLFYPGWEEPELMRGYLHGATTHADDPRYPKTWMHISDNPTMPDGEDAASLGGYALWTTDTFEVVTLSTKPLAKG